MMVKTYWKNIVVFLFLAVIPVASSGQNIFPGAEGMGTQSPGAYGGSELPQIVVVDNLHDSGSGSLRHALNRPFPRIVVFEVSGDIFLESPIVVRVPFLHVAGQTAPGKGIAVWGHPFVIGTHDVLIQDMRFRLGSGHQKQSDCATVRGTSLRTFNVVFDHCSFAFGLDETLTILNAGPGITISNSIVGYSLDGLEHSCGLLVLNSFNVSLIRNVLAFNGDRNPTIRGDSRKVEVINNLIYNSESHAIYLGSRGPRNYPVDVILKSNHYITGPDNMNRFLLSVHEQVADSLNVFWSDNTTLHKGRLQRSYDLQLFDKSNRFTPVSQTPFTSSVDLVICSDVLEDSLLSSSGARPRNRDAVDSLLVSNIRQREGNIIKDEEELGIPMTLPNETKGFEIPDDPHLKDANDFTRLQNHLQKMLEDKSNPFAREK
ncbi:pectate lyase [Marinilabilia sp.]|uniref:pectate lyase n=1 Tax=Marinilabilia sp. TaxID=2021252 RepID=UPI0025BA7D0A|nr:pectate lyase [Marinilabilia sp.]